MHRLTLLLFAFVLIVPLAAVIYAGLRPDAPRVEVGSEEAASQQAVPQDTAAGEDDATESPVPAAPRGGADRLAPVDEASQDADLAGLRDAALAAARAQDLTAMVAAAADDIALGFGGETGRERFRQLLIENPAVDGIDYWQELEAVLALGGVFVTPHAFCTPYVACVELPCGDAACTPYGTFVATGDAVAVHAEPDASSDVVATLSYTIVKAARDTGNDAPRHRAWIEIALPDGGTGFVQRGQVRAPTDYRMWIERRDGDWRITSFVNGA